MSDITYEELDFSEYDDPERAKTIWTEYLPDMTRRGLEIKAVNILESCHDSRTLDIHLAALLPISSVCTSGPSPTDEDSNGSWANAVKRYEGN